uniref:PUM-HD domain-containing protein n=1 Tax=Rhabditophanes sp. KR3021 TaxID=114890 RepID=A0AC35TY78_9BILA
MSSISSDTYDSYLQNSEHVNGEAGDGNSFGQRKPLFRSFTKATEEDTEHGEDHKVSSFPVKVSIPVEEEDGGWRHVGSKPKKDIITTGQPSSTPSHSSNPLMSPRNGSHDVSQPRKQIVRTSVQVNQNWRDFSSLANEVEKKPIRGENVRFGVKGALLSDMDDNWRGKKSSKSPITISDNVSDSSHHNTSYHQSMQHDQHHHTSGKDKKPPNNFGWSNEDKSFQDSFSNKDFHATDDSSRLFDDIDKDRFNYACGNFNDTTFSTKESFSAFGGGFNDLMLSQMQNNLDNLMIEPDGGSHAFKQSGSNYGESVIENLFAPPKNRFGAENFDYLEHFNGNSNRNDLVQHQPQHHNQQPPKQHNLPQVKNNEAFDNDSFDFNSFYTFLDPTSLIPPTNNHQLQQQANAMSNLNQSLSGLYNQQQNAFPMGRNNGVDNFMMPHQELDILNTNGHNSLMKNTPLDKMAMAPFRTQQQSNDGMPWLPQTLPNDQLNEFLFEEMTSQRNEYGDKMRPTVNPNASKVCPELMSHNEWHVERGCLLWKVVDNAGIIQGPFDAAFFNYFFETNNFSGIQMFLCPNIHDMKWTKLSDLVRTAFDRNPFIDIKCERSKREYFAVCKVLASVNEEIQQSWDSYLNTNLRDSIVTQVEKQIEADRRNQHMNEEMQRNLAINKKCESDEYQQREMEKNLQDNTKHQFNEDRIENLMEQNTKMYVAKLSTTEKQMIGYDQNFIDNQNDYIHNFDRPIIDQVTDVIQKNKTRNMEENKGNDIGAILRETYFTGSPQQETHSRNLYYNRNNSIKEPTAEELKLYNEPDWVDNIGKKKKASGMGYMPSQHNSFIPNQPQMYGVERTQVQKPPLISNSKTWASPNIVPDAPTTYQPRPMTFSLGELIPEHGNGGGQPRQHENPSSQQGPWRAIPSARTTGPSFFSPPPVQQQPVVSPKSAEPKPTHQVVGANFATLKSKSGAAWNVSDKGSVNAISLGKCAAPNPAESPRKVKKNAQCELIAWLVQEFRNIQKDQDVTEFCNFIVDVEHFADVEDYFTTNFGDNRQIKKLSKDFMSKRSELRNRISTAKYVEDDLSAPAQTIDKMIHSAQAPKKNKKKGAKVAKQLIDPTLLGFTTVSNPNRLNVGEIQQL